jgi:hypothetical protein
MTKLPSVPSRPVCGSGNVKPLHDPVLILKRKDAPALLDLATTMCSFHRKSIQPCRIASIATNPTKVVRRSAIG